MPRILVVDDQNIPRTAVAGMLRQAGHEVATADGGEEGLALALEWSPDVVVLDVHMPDLNGFEVVERLKQDPRTARTPVIFLTADAPTDDLLVRGLELGAYDFLSKGCSRAELLARVGVMVRIKRGNDELSAIARISDTLIRTLDLREMSERLVEQVRDVFRADAVLLGLSTDDGEGPFRYAVGLDAGDPLCESLADALLERAGGDGQAGFELTDLSGPAGVLVRRHRFQSAIAARLDFQQRPPMLLAVLACRPDAFVPKADAALLRLLARQTSIALDNATLHAHTREQARKMEEQAEALERAMSERSRFFASMSHELRTPINAVLGYNQLLEMGALGEINPEQAGVVENMRRSATHLLELINDILDISKIEAGKLEIAFEPTDLVALIRDTVTSVQLQAQEKGLTLQINVPERAEVKTDPARVRQILLNLLANAVKFTQEGGVEVELLERSPGFELRVTDTGPGIAPEDQERVFEEFEQTRSASSQGGTGLGLAISRRLAHLIGGELALESTPGEGSTFLLRIPATPPHPGEAADAEVTPDPAAGA